MWCGDWGAEVSHSTEKISSSVGYSTVWESRSLHNIDIGANHPFMLSNTALFYKRGSRGVNIEPNPLQFAEIRRCRREDTNIMAGIGAERSTMPFYVMSTDTLSTF